MFNDRIDKNIVLRFMWVGIHTPHSVGGPWSGHRIHKDLLRSNMDMKTLRESLTH